MLILCILVMDKNNQHSQYLDILSNGYIITIALSITVILIQIRILIFILSKEINKIHQKVN